MPRNYDFFRRSNGKWVYYVSMDGLTVDAARREAESFRRHLRASIKATYSYTGKTAFIIA